MATSEVDNDARYNDVTVPIEEIKTTEQAIEDAFSDDPDLVEVIASLARDVSLEPDRDLNLEETGSLTDSVSTSGSLREIEETDEVNGESSSSAVKNGKTTQQSTTSSKNSSSPNGSTISVPSSNHKLLRRPSVESTASNGKSSSSGSKKTSGSSIRNPLKALKKLTKLDKSDSKKRNENYKSEFTAVIVDRLPQVFVVKYLGHRPVNGMCGLHLVRRPVDELVKEVRQKIDGDSPSELPLLYVVISAKGIDLREHKKNKIKHVAPLGLMPIDFISYGVQDIKYWRVFCCIEVRELSSRTPRSATCHAFLCDSSHSGRKMALSIGAAFGVHAKTLKHAGKQHNFQVELRPPDELADALEDYEA